jgi:hypothetical protein
MRFLALAILTLTLLAPSVSNACVPEPFFRRIQVSPPTSTVDTFKVLSSAEIGEHVACVHFLQVTINGSADWDPYSIYLTLRQGNAASGHSDTMVAIQKRWLLGNSINVYPGNFMTALPSGARMLHGRCTDPEADLFIAPDTTRFGSPAEIVVAGVLECPGP